MAMFNQTEAFSQHSIVTLGQNLFMTSTHALGMKFYTGICLKFAHRMDLNQNRQMWSKDRNKWTEDSVYSDQARGLVDTT